MATPDSVRPARPEDAPAIAALQLRAWRSSYAEVLPPSALDVADVDVATAWAAAIGTPPSPTHRVLVAVGTDGLVGFAACAPDGDGVAELAALHVDAEHARQGHGSRLLAACVDHWRGDGELAAAPTSTAVAWVWEADQPLAGLLRGSGWAPDGARRSLDGGASQHRWHTAL